MNLHLISLIAIVTAPFVASEVCNGFATCLSNVTTVKEGDKVTLLCTLRNPKPTQSCIWTTPDGTYVHPNSGKNNCSLHLNDVAPYMGGIWTCVESVRGVVQKDLKNNQHSVSGTLVVKGKCYAGNGAHYAGKQTRTASGKKCALWSVANLKNSNQKAMDASNYPEKNISNAVNYCRNPDGDKQPWCYTTSPGTRWEFCNITKCDNKCQGNTLSTLIKGCGNYFLECSGVIINADPNAVTLPPLARNYGNNQACTYNMTSPMGTVIKLTSVEFRLEDKYDTLAIYDGSKSGAKLGDYTGSTSFSVVSSSNQVTLVFSTDATITKEGFRINFQIVAGCTPLNINKCGKYNVNCYGDIYSQNYGIGDYNSHADCSYNLVAPPNSQIQFTSINFNTEKNYDNLTIYDGSSSGNVLGFYNGINRNFSVITQKSSAVLRFISDHAKTLKGFHLKYVVTPNGNMYPTLPPTLPTTTKSCVETKTTGCGVYGGCRGTIKSQNYPLNYPNDAKCRYIIQGQPTSLITLRSTSFNTEECCDTLTVYDGMVVTKDAKPVAVYRGNNVDIDLVIKGVATLVFQSDNAKTDSGFQINYTITN